MTKAELIAELERLDQLERHDYTGDDPMYGDTEMIHIAADDALLKYIGDNEVAAAFGRIRKWYA